MSFFQEQRDLEVLLGPPNVRLWNLLSWGFPWVGGYHHSWIEERRVGVLWECHGNQLLWPTFAIYLKLYETRSTAQKFPVHGVRCSCSFSPHQVMRGTFFRVRKQVSTTFLNNFWTSPPFYWDKTNFFMWKKIPKRGIRTSTIGHGASWKKWWRCTRQVFHLMQNCPKFMVSLPMFIPWNGLKCMKKHIHPR